MIIDQSHYCRFCLNFWKNMFIKKLVTCLETRDLFPPLQSAFRHKHSCNTALARLTDSWLSAINRPDLSRDVFLDFKKAFDLVDYRILPSKLSVYINSSNSLLFSVHTLKKEYNVSLSVAPNRLKELLNMVYHKGQSWGLYFSAYILLIYLCICYQILQHIICSRMTQNGTEHRLLGLIVDNKFR